MRVAFFSPMPPAKSGIADYSAALVEEMRKLAAVDVFSGGTPFESSSYDIALYQIGNNPFHAHAYETALAHPGVVVMHEANLHHLITDLTIRRSDWDSYIAECDYNGGTPAMEYARRVKALEVGPDYEGLPMLRRLLERSRGAVAHSRTVEDALRAAGFAGPIARIPHGAWILTPDRWAYRYKLGLDEQTPLIGIFGFLKPYKRIAESLRAFRRLVRLNPDAKMILAGEPHPDFPLHRLVRELGLSAHVRVLGFASPEDFIGYMAACDVVLNLRFPTVGESSGTLLRALGMGRATIVSNVGSFEEFPDEVCLKVPVDSSEEDVLFEYMNLLVSRPEAARSLGESARRWVERECRWEVVARQYCQFLERIVAGGEWNECIEPVEEPAAPAPAPIAAALPPVELPAAEETEEYLQSWATTDSDRGYVDTHLTRLEKTLRITPPGGPEDRILEMGAYMQITPALRSRLGYGEVRGCYFGEAGTTEHKTVRSLDGEEFTCYMDLFDAEKDPFPYPGEHFTTVLCCELIEHLAADPMFLMSEVNRILKPGGRLVLTTPNIGSLRAISAILQGYHPGFFPAYIRPGADDGEVEARHNREYTPKEIILLLLDAGFEVELIETGPFRKEPRPEDHWVTHLLDRYMLPVDLRGDGIYAVGRKTGPVRTRYPGWLYSEGT